MVTVRLAAGGSRGAGAQGAGLIIVVVMIVVVMVVVVMILVVMIIASRRGSRSRSGHGSRDLGGRLAHMAGTRVLSKILAVIHSHRGKAVLRGRHGAHSRRTRWEPGQARRTQQRPRRRGSEQEAQ